MKIDARKISIQAIENQVKKIKLFENERASTYNEFVQTWIPGYNDFLDQLPKVLS